MTLLRVNQLHKDFGGLKAVNDVTFDVEAGEVIGIIGPNGAGKTTLFNLITGFLPVTSGTVTFNGRVITKQAPHQICQLGLVRTFQQAKPFPKLSVFDNVLVSAFLRNPTKKAANDLVEQVLQRVGIFDRKDKKAKDLTVAEMKRLEIARVLATTPKMILLDEAMAGLNAVEVEEVSKLIRSLRQEEGITFLIIEHIMQAIMQLSDRIVVLYHGNKIAEGKPVEIAHNEQVIEAYLGKEEESA